MNNTISISHSFRPAPDLDNPEPEVHHWEIRVPVNGEVTAEMVRDLASAFYEAINSASGDDGDDAGIGFEPDFGEGD